MNSGSKAPGGAPSWKEIVAKYQKPSFWRSIWQVVNTYTPYCMLWYLMYLSLSVSYWLTVPLAFLAGLVLLRIFIIFHDCGHGSFFKSKIANHIVGSIGGLLCFTSYFHWRWEHAQHHARTSDLDHRGQGDVWTLTVQEYKEAPLWKRMGYRFVRNPAVLFVFAPLYLFFVWQRFPSPNASKFIRNSIYWTNALLAGMVFALSSIFGLKAYLVIQVTVMGVAGSIGVWLFYVQHQFEGVYWERSKEWDFVASALEGSSFYKLPKVLQWMTGNIGFHHIHHLSPRIPNYYLEKCYKAEPFFQEVKAITLIASLKSFTFRLWDEQQRKLVGYRALRERRQPEHDLTNGA